MTPDTIQQKIGSDGRVEVYRARLLAVFGGRKTFPHGLDPLKRTVCRRILELSDGLGTRTVAEGAETRADFLAARELGFDVVQGYYFGKPMERKKFARHIVRRSVSDGR